MDDKCNIYGFEQSKGTKSMAASLPVQIFSEANFSAILAEKVAELAKWAD